MIIPEEAENNFALLYEKDNGGIAVSRAESPYNWFIKYSYDTPSMGNFHRLGQTDAEAADKRPNENLIRSFCTLLNPVWSIHGDWVLSLDIGVIT